VYLSWKAREYDYYTNFVDLTAEVNGNMPYFVAQKTTRALAAQGRALSTTKVLVLGVAFKRDVGDARNSSALRLMERIHTDHSVFRWDSIVTRCRPVLDTRNATHGVPATAGVVARL
jgi:UDP-N-acetyl-D-mannosaminuronate dehydrogenase